MPSREAVRLHQPSHRPQIQRCMLNHRRLAPQGWAMLAACGTGEAQQSISAFLVMKCGSALQHGIYVGSIWMFQCVPARLQHISTVTVHIIPVRDPPHTCFELLFHLCQPCHRFAFFWNDTATACRAATPTSMTSDPFLSYVVSTLSKDPGLPDKLLAGSGATGSSGSGQLSHRSSGAVDVRPWLMKWTDFEVQQPIGAWQHLLAGMTRLGGHPRDVLHAKRGRGGNA